MTRGLHEFRDDLESRVPGHYPPPVVDHAERHELESCCNACKNVVQL